MPSPWLAAVAASALLIGCATLPRPARSLDYKAEGGLIGFANRLTVLVAPDPDTTLLGSDRERDDQAATDPQDPPPFHVKVALDGLRVEIGPGRAPEVGDSPPAVHILHLANGRSSSRSCPPATAGSSAVTDSAYRSRTAPRAAGGRVLGR